MSSFWVSICSKFRAPVIDSGINVTSKPNINQSLIQLADILDLSLLCALLNCIPNLIVDVIRMLHFWLNEIWRFSTKKFYVLTNPVRKCWALLKNKKIFRLNRWIVGRSCWLFLLRVPGSTGNDDDGVTCAGARQPVPDTSSVSRGKFGTLTSWWARQTMKNKRAA